MKAKTAGADPYKGMLDHRTTPSQGLNATLAQRLLCRRTRTLLPSEITTDKDKPNITERQQRTCTHLHKETKALQPTWFTDIMKYNRTLEMFLEGPAITKTEPRYNSQFSNTKSDCWGTPTTAPSPTKALDYTLIKLTAMFGHAVVTTVT